MITKFNQFLNESLRDKLKGKSKEEVLDNIKDLSNQEKLEKACDNGYLEIVKDLLKHKDIDLTYDHSNCLYISCKKGYIDIVKELLKDRRLNNIIDIKFALRVAKGENNIDIFNIIKDYLNKKDIIINESLRDKLKGKSEEEMLGKIKRLPPEQQFSKAIQYNFLPLVKKLISEGIDPSYNTNTSIVTACGWGHLEIVKELLKDSRVDLSDNNYNAVYHAALNNRIEVLRYLIDNKYFGKNDYGFGDILRISSERNFIDLIKMLFNDYDVDVHTSIDIAIRSAAEYGHLDLVKFLLDRGADISADGNSPFMYAAENNHIDVVKFLLDNGVVIKDSELEYRLYDGDMIIFLKKYLDENDIKHINNILKESLRDKIKGKSEKDILDIYKNDEEKLLKKSIEYNYMDGIRYALEKGAKYNMGKALICASDNNDIELIKLLLQRINLDYNNWRSVKIAAEKGNLDIIKLFIDNYYIPYKVLMYCVSWSKYYGHIEVSKLIIDYINKNDIKHINNILKESLRDKIKSKPDDEIQNEVNLKLKPILDKAKELYITKDADPDSDVDEWAFGLSTVLEVQKIYSSLILFVNDELDNEHDHLLSSINPFIFKCVDFWLKENFSDFNENQIHSFWKGFTYSGFEL